jgi:four helix bundle protein
MGNFRELRVWQDAKDLSVSIYRMTQRDEFKRDFGFRDQIQRSAISIPSYIAEGDESGSDKLSIRYFYIAKGSAAELITQLIISEEIGYIDIESKDLLVDQCEKISSMLSNLIKSRSRKGVRPQA